MPRRKKIAAAELTVDDRLAARQKDKDAILAEMTIAEAQIEEQKKILKAKKKEMRVVDKDIAALQAEKEAESEAKAVEEQKAAMAKIIEGLLQKGKTAEDILGAFPD